MGGAALAELAEHLKRDRDLPCDARRASVVVGGSINRCYRLPAPAGDMFVKLNAPERLQMFEAEAAGLKTLGAAAAIAVPRVLAVGAYANGAYLVLEWLDFSGQRRGAEARLGRELARQHATGQARFGWERDNTIGSTPQPNAPADDWLEFLRERRLGYQLELAATHALPPELLDAAHRVLARLDDFFAGYEVAPALLHGDLWSGNWAATAEGSPYVFDPAVYFGDREMDLAMTRMFGGFGEDFYAAYERAWPLDRGAAARRDLYELYHWLNHYNLFGASYLEPVAACLARLSARPRRT